MHVMKGRDATGSDANADAAPSACTCFRMRRLTRRISQRYDQALAPAGLTVNQYSILRHAGGEPRTVGALAEALGMDRSTLSRELTPLASAGWVERVAGDDARERLVCVTTAGRRTLREAEPLWREAQDAVEAALGASGVTTLHRALDRATDLLA